MRIIGLDIGDKNIGIAISDKNNKLATPMTTLKNDNNFKISLLELIKEYSIGKIIIGLPISLKGKEESQAKKVRDFIKDIDLEKEAKVVFYDERFTTKIAEQNIKKSLKKKKNDVLSATVLLNDYLGKKDDEK